MVRQSYVHKMVRGSLVAFKDTCLDVAFDVWMASDVRPFAYFLGDLVATSEDMHVHCLAHEYAAASYNETKVTLMESLMKVTDVQKAQALLDSSPLCCGEALVVDKGFTVFPSDRQKYVATLVNTIDDTHSALESALRYASAPGASLIDLLRQKFVAKPSPPIEKTTEAPPTEKTTEADPSPAALISRLCNSETRATQECDSEDSAALSQLQFEFVSNEKKDAA